MKRPVPYSCLALIGATLLCTAPASTLAQSTDYTTIGASSSSALAGWPLNHLYDGRTDTVWSSNGYSTPENREWVTILLDQKRNVNYLNFATRFSDGNSFGFPLHGILAGHDRLEEGDQHRQLRTPQEPVDQSHAARDCLLKHVLGGRTGTGR